MCFYSLVFWLQINTGSLFAQTGRVLFLKPVTSFIYWHPAQPSDAESSSLSLFFFSFYLHFLWLFIVSSPESQSLLTVCVWPHHNVSSVSSVLQLTSMGSESEVLMKEYSKMMTDMIVLCATLALSLFFWIVSVTLSAYSGEPWFTIQLSLLRFFCAPRWSCSDYCSLRWISVFLQFQSIFVLACKRILWNGDASHMQPV